MIPSIPIATDNLYKFATLLGLVMIVTGFSSGAYTLNEYNKRYYKDYIEFKILEASESLSKEGELKRDALRSNIEFDRTESVRSSIILFALGWFGLAVSIAGLYTWYRKVQPRQDDLLNLQIEKMRREIQVLEKQLEQKREE